MKKLFAIILILSLALSLTACGDKDNPGGNNPGGNAESVKLAQGVVTLTEAQAAGISFDSENGTLIATGDAKSVIEKGRIIVIPPTENNPYGATVRITDFTDEGDKRVCQYEIPPVNEVIESIDTLLDMIGPDKKPEITLDLGAANFTFAKGSNGSVSYNGGAVSGKAGGVKLMNPYTGLDCPEGTVDYNYGKDITGSASVSNMKLDITNHWMEPTPGQFIRQELFFDFSADIQMTVSTNDYGTINQRYYSVPIYKTDDGFVMRLLVDIEADASYCVSGGNSMTMNAHIEIGTKFYGDNQPEFTRSGDVSFNTPASPIQMLLGGILIFEYQGIPLYDICFSVRAEQSGSEYIEYKHEDDGKKYEIAWHADWKTRKGLNIESGFNYKGAPLSNGMTLLVWQEEIYNPWGNGVTGSGRYTYESRAKMSNPSGLNVWSGTGPSGGDGGAAGP